MTREDKIGTAIVLLSFATGIILGPMVYDMWSWIVWGCK